MKPCPLCGAPHLRLWLTTHQLYCGSCEYTAQTGVIAGYVD